MRGITSLFAVVMISLPAFAQTQEISFNGLRADSTEPVEVTADQLNVNQESGKAVFTGNVLVVQGTLRMTSARIDVFYVEGSKSEIDHLRATGGVTLVSPTQAAEGAEAVYDVPDGTIVMTGNVLLTQGDNVMSGNRLNVNLRTGTGQMQGRVHAIFKPVTK